MRTRLCKILNLCFGCTKRRYVSLPLITLHLGFLMTSAPACVLCLDRISLFGLLRAGCLDGVQASRDLAESSTIRPASSRPFARRIKRRLTSSSADGLWILSPPELLELAESELDESPLIMSFNDEPSEDPLSELIWFSIPLLVSWSTACENSVSVLHPNNVKDGYDAYARHRP